uniref:Uncharacterized LOC109514461 n=1 Tax=Hippocampus comes TaxID=109280 RepID=A0A3Q2XHT3_HIPCM
MVSTSVLVLQLLLISLVSASHHYGGLSTFSSDINSDGTFTVNISFKDTFDGCHASKNIHCSNGNCGYEVSRHRVVLDNSTNSPTNTRQWCEVERVITRRVPSNKPFSLSLDGCCWIPTRNFISYWIQLTTVDLGTRSDTREPNKSPATGMLPLVRVPQNCPRAYKIMAFDADGDRVRCRYGKISNKECSRCRQPVGFYLNQDSCTLHYDYTLSDPRVFGFELVVEDFPQQPITLSYSDGSHCSRSPLMARKKRYPVSPPNSRPYKTTTEHSWSRWSTTTPEPWGQRHTTRGEPPTDSLITSAPPTVPWWKHYMTPSQGMPSTGSWTTSAPPTQVPWKTTTAPPWWWWTQRTTGRAATPSRTAVQRQTVTNPWWWLFTESTASTTTLRSWHPTITSWTPTTRHPYAPTPALSKLPLQFSLLVDPPVPSCQEGLYIPRLVYPTPQNGQHIYVEVNKEVEIRVKAQAVRAEIHDIIMSGPANANKHRTTHDEFVIRWIPRPGDEGKHRPLCFSVESVIRRHALSVYQSEMRCVLLEVQKAKVKATVTCAESNMTVVVERASLHWIDLDHLRLCDPYNVECSLQRHSNSTHVVAVIPLNSCGTQLEEDDDNLIFKNEIITVDNPRLIVTRTHRLEVGFHCQYPKRGNVTQSFIAHRESITVWEKGFGTFTYQFEFYPDAQFRTIFSPTLYPLDYKLGNRIYMKIEASSLINNTELFVESCRAAPYDNPNSQPTYSIIENGCPIDPTVQIYTPAHEHEFRFSIEAFQFIGLHDHVYISCSVLTCEAGNPHTRCSHGCIQTTWTDDYHHHVKREAVIQSAKHLVSQGPLRLK